MKAIVLDIITGVVCDTFESAEKAQGWIDDYRVDPAYKAEHYRVVDYETYWQSRGYFKCRNCGESYNSAKTSADWRGYCSQKCVHAKAKALGYKPGQKRFKPGFRTPSTITEYDVLKRHDALGDKR